jgi:hypothetical protein
VLDRIIAYTNPINLIDPYCLDPLDCVSDFLKAIPDVLFTPPPSLADPDAIKGAGQLLDGVQDRYVEWGETTGEWGPENPWYFSFGIQTRDGRSYLDRIRNYNNQ